VSLSAQLDPPRASAASGSVGTLAGRAFPAPKDGLSALKLVVVIVNYRTPSLALDCLRSVAPEIAAIPGSRAVVVDNASGDGSQETLAAAIERERWSSWASLVQAGRNGGFSFGNNVAVRSVLASAEKPEYVHLLNPDTLVRPGALRELMEFMDRHPEVGIAGSRLESLDAAIHRSAFRFPNLAAEFESALGLGIVSRLLANRIVAPPSRGEAHVTDWICAASMMIRSRVFEDIGLFDEQYFLYCEETDFCLQARHAGWPCWYVPASRVVHLGGQSTGLNDTSTPMPRYWFESRRHYFAKNHGRAYLMLANLAWLTGFSLWRIRQRLQSKPSTVKPRMFSDFIRLSFLADRNGR
jgi:N-acetylglucosaminyl-diphospho-decaprenol L-rhamnosyltransferase